MTQEHRLTGSPKQQRTALHQQLKPHMLNALKFHTIECMPACEQGMTKLVRTLQGTATRTKHDTVLCAVLGACIAASLLSSTVRYLTPETIICKVTLIKHLHNVETRSYCSQTFLDLDSQCKDAVSEFELTLWNRKELKHAPDTILGMSNCWNMYLKPYLACQVARTCT